MSMSRTKQKKVTAMATQPQHMSCKRTTTSLVLVRAVQVNDQTDHTYIEALMQETVLEMKGHRFLLTVTDAMWFTCDIERAVAS